MHSKRKLSVLTPTDYREKDVRIPLAMDVLFYAQTPSSAIDHLENVSRLTDYCE